MGATTGDTVAGAGAGEGGRGSGEGGADWVKLGTCVLVHDGLGDDSSIAEAVLFTAERKANPHIGQFFGFRSLAKDALHEPHVNLEKSCVHSVQ